MMFRKILYYLNRRVVLVFVCLILLVAGFVLYIQSQQPLAERLSGDYSWCLFPPSVLFSVTFKEDGSFGHTVTTLEEHPTAHSESGKWTIYEEDDQSWIQVIYQDKHLGEKRFPIKASLGSYYLRLQGDFFPLAYRNVNLFRCARRGH